MGQFIKGHWHTNNNFADESGAFERKPTTFRNRINSASKFKPTSGRYHLYVSTACPWAHRTLIVRQLKCLEDQVSLSIVDPHMGERSWHFSSNKGCIPDHVNNCETLGQVYLKAVPEFTGKVTVPVLWDKETSQIVNNESSDIIKIFSEDLAGLVDTTEIALYPLEKQKQIDDMILANYEPVNNGVYKAGFASKQKPYEDAVTALFNQLDAIESLLARTSYLCGETLTLADICLYTTLVRFDLVYHYHFKCNLKKIRDYPNLSRFLQHLHYDHNFSATCDFDHIKTHYYASHESINPQRIIPIGPESYV